MESQKHFEGIHSSRKPVTSLRTANISMLNFFQGVEKQHDQLPGSGRSLQLPREIIQRLRDVIFGFDFFVSSVENYQANGVLFKGNLRAEPSLAYDRIAARLKVCWL